MTPTTTTAATPDICARIRFHCPDRSAPVDPRTIDSLLPHDHPARRLWRHVCSLDLTPVTATYRARHHHPGRRPVDPRLLSALWLQATAEGVRSARHLARLCKRDDVFKWLCGGVRVNYHSLADFRVRHGAWLDSQITAAVAGLHAAGLVPLDEVGQDGLRIRAWAGSDSFKTLPQLQAAVATAQARFDQLQAADRAAAATRGTRRRTKQEAAQLRGARDRCARLGQALQAYGPQAEAREARKQGDGVKTRVSVTDPECRKMKMPDGGYRPAYNGQFATDLESLVPVAATVTDAGNDAGQATVLQGAVERAYAKRARGWYMDGGFATNAEIEALTAAGVTVFTPIKAERQRRARGEDPAVPKAGESAAVAAWRARMCSAAGREAYKKRGLTELTHAAVRNWGLYQVTVRGLEKVGAAVLWYVWALVLQRRDLVEHKRAAAVAAGEAGAVAVGAAAPVGAAAAAAGAGAEVAGVVDSS